MKAWNVINIYNSSDDLDLHQRLDIFLKSERLKNNGYEDQVIEINLGTNMLSINNKISNKLCSVSIWMRMESRQSTTGGKKRWQFSEHWKEWYFVRPGNTKVTYEVLHYSKWNQMNTYSAGTSRQTLSTRWRKFVDPW